MPTPEGSHRRIWPAALVAGGVLYRLAYLAELSHLPDWSRPIGDEISYIEAADRLLRGGACQPFHLSPLFITLLASLRRFDLLGPVSFRALLLGLGVTGALLVYGVGRRLLGETAGRWALGLCLFCGPLLFYESNLDVATVASTTTLAALYCAVRWDDAGRAGQGRAGQDLRAGLLSWLLAGLFIGLGIAARPNAALLCGPLLLAPFVLRRGARLWQRVLLALAAPTVAVLVTLPVTIYNRHCDPHLVWITDTGGMNLYIGNHREANGTFNIPRQTEGAGNTEQQQAIFSQVASVAAGRPLSLTEVSTYWRDAALREIAAAPGHWLALEARKLLLVFSYRELSKNRSYELRSQVLRAQGPWLLQVGYLAPLAALGLLLLLVRPRQSYFLLSFTLSYVAALLVLFVLGDYRQVLLPLFILCAVAAGQALHRLWRAWRAEPRKGALLLGALVLTGALALLCHRPWPDLDSSADDAFKFAMGLHLGGDLPGAERWYQAALAAYPEHLEAAENLAILYMTEQRLQEAQRMWTVAAGIAQKSGRQQSLRKAQRYLERLRGVSGTPPAP